MVKTLFLCKTSKLYTAINLCELSITILRGKPSTASYIICMVYFHGGTPNHINKITTNCPSNCF